MRESQQTSTSLLQDDTQFRVQQVRLGPREQHLACAKDAVAAGFMTCKCSLEN